MINCIVEDIIKRFNINKFVETGVFMGDTLMVMQNIFCKLYPDFNTGPWNQGVKGKYRIYEVESNEQYLNQGVRPRVQEQINVELACSDSVDWLKKAIDRNEFTQDDGCFFYLDAHGNSNNPEPLVDEIAELKNLKNKPIISIDDWAVPGFYKDIYSTDMIRHLIKKRTDVIYYTLYHNFHGKRSCFFFLDRFSDELDEKLKGLPLIKEML